MPVPVWDIAVRVFHWGLAVLVALAALTGGTGARLHEVVGGAIAGLLVFRVIWGFAGTTHARFRDFPPAPRKIINEARALAAGKPANVIGHNPLGGVMIYALLLTLCLLTVSGIAMHTNFFFGVAWVETTHIYAGYALLGLVIAHLGGVVVASWLHHENLPRAMIVGHKNVVCDASDAKMHDRFGALAFRLYGLEGLVLLQLMATAGGLGGFLLTASRVDTATPPTNESAPAPAPAPAPSRPATASALSPIEAATLPDAAAPKMAPAAPSNSASKPQSN